MEDKKLKLRCPKCKGTRFNVLVEASQRWDSEEDEWEDLEVLEVREVTNAYLCLDCNKTFRSTEQLEKY